MYVMGTAGHIDHGKSLLVKALTGIDPDRLREEKERGMTTELGFAWLTLPSGRDVGIVDVPGHERFVRHMLAGVGGIDLALLIIAANEGVMPQTREHLAILDLIGVRKGIVVITKKDLVDEDLLSLVNLEIEEVVADTVLAEAPVLAVSAVTGEGLPELKSAIDKMLDTTEPRRDLGRPRLAIDRIFTIAGSGTVVTGTLIDGTLSVGQEVEVAPSGIKSRIRGLQTHKSKIGKAEPGSRVAANLVGLNTSQLERGNVVTTPGWLSPSKLITVKLDLISYLKRPLRHGAIVSFHTLASETMARVRLLEADELAPGGSTWAQFTLEKPLAVINGDHYIIRSTNETLGGGSIIDARAKNLRRFRPEIIENLKAAGGSSPGEIIFALLDAKQPIEVNSLITQANLEKETAGPAIASLVAENKAVSLGEGGQALLFTAAGWKRLSEKVIAILTEYHRRYPVRTGMPSIETGSQLKLGGHVQEAITRMVKEGLIAESGNNLRLPSHNVRLNPAQQSKVDAFLRSLEANPFSPPADFIPELDVLNMLIEQEKVIKVSDNIVFPAAAYQEMLAKITERIRTTGKVGLGEVRDMFGTSRKYAQAILEYFDREKITRRVGDDRVLY